MTETEGQVRIVTEGQKIRGQQTERDRERDLGHEERDTNKL